MISGSSSLHRLWALADQQPPEDGEAYNTYFDPIGLLLSWPLKPSSYEWCAPSNMLVFAGTGGDGVHFGLLSNHGLVSEASPVVMTVPMAMEGNTNFIVGETLRDFLALGCRRGYFFLEQLAYQPDSLLPQLTALDFAPDMSDIERALLGSIGNAFELQPWGECVAKRLKQLNDKFLSLLAFPSAS